jgi:hypothetical protein
MWLAAILAAMYMAGNIFIRGSGGTSESDFLTTGIEQRCDDLGAACICSETMAGDEAGATVGANYDYVESPTATECWGDRSGTSGAMGFTSGTGLQVARTAGDGWGIVPWALKGSGSARWGSTEIRSGQSSPLEITTEQRICWRHYLQVDSDFSNAGGTGNDAGSDVGGYAQHWDTPTSDEQAVWVYDTARQLRHVGGDVTTDWNSDGGTPLKIIQTTGSAVTYTQYDGTTFASGDTTMSIRSGSPDVPNDTYTFVGRGCDGCPRNKHGFVDWGTDSKFTYSEQSTGVALPATDPNTHYNWNMNVGGGPFAASPGPNYLISGGNLAFCVDAPCRVEYCVAGGLVDGDTIAFEMHIYRTDTGFQASKTTPYRTANGGPSLDRAGPLMNHTGGDVPSGGTGSWYWGMAMEARWETDAGQLIGCAEEIEGVGC